MSTGRAFVAQLKRISLEAFLDLPPPPRFPAAPYGFVTLFLHLLDFRVISVSSPLDPRAWLRAQAFECGLPGCEPRLYLR